jgi:hypothetical protein
VLHSRFNDTREEGIRMSARQQRVDARPEEVRRARELLRGVPSFGLDWSSPSGRTFLAYIEELIESGVPLTWLAEHLQLDINRLYSALNRYRRTSA